MKGRDVRPMTTTEKGMRGFLSFVYVDKIAGFLFLLCQRCHSGANGVGFFGGSLLKGDSFWAETNTDLTINTVSACQLIQ